jgi:Docking domain of Afi1 for Arf3 in vesicle trafficking
MFSQMLAELMLPDQVHNREEDWTIFFLHKGPDEGEPEGEAGLMYVLSLVNKKMDQTAKRYLLNCTILIFRGAVVKAIAICTRHSFLHIYKVYPFQSVF